MRSSLGLLGILAMGLLPAMAQAEDAATAAKKHLAAGGAYFQQNDFANALKEFEQGRKAKPLPALDYGIARCLEIMERFPEAVGAYERYLKEAPKAKTYKTPQEVFDGFLASLNKRDAKAFVGCLAPETLKEMAGAYAVQGLQRREIVGDGKDDKLAKRWKPTLDVLDKHGLTTKATKDVKVGNFLPALVLAPLGAYLLGR